MNRKIATALVLAAAAAGNAFADDITIDTTPFVATQTRAQVQADLAAYKQAGVNPWSTSYNPLAKFKSVKSRDQVVAEFQAARAEVAAVTSEDSGSAYYAQVAARPVNASTTLAGRPANNAQ